MIQKRTRARHRRGADPDVTVPPSAQVHWGFLKKQWGEVAQNPRISLYDKESITHTLLHVYAVYIMLFVAVSTPLSTLRKNSYNPFFERELGARFRNC